MRRLGLVLAALATPVGAHAQSAKSAQAEAQALDIAKRSIAFRSVRGESNQTKQLADYLKGVLVEGGFAAGDVTVTPVDDTAMLVATYPAPMPPPSRSSFRAISTWSKPSRPIGSAIRSPRWWKMAISSAAARPT